MGLRPGVLSELEWLETVEAQEDNILSFNQATTLINKYGEDLDGLFGMTSVATPASAEAVSQAGLCGEVAVVGLATPNAMKPYVPRTASSRWCCGTRSISAMPRSTSCARSPTASCSRVPRRSRPAGSATLQIVNGSEVLLGPPFVYSKDNIDDFDF